MGLLTSSAALRAAALQRNLYTPEKPYDLRRDAVTQTLDALQEAGINGRASMLLSGIEALVDHTPIVVDGYKQLAIAMGRTMADTFAHEHLPSIRLDRLLVPGASVIEGPGLDTTITPRPRADSLNDFIERTLGAPTPPSALDGPGREYKPGGLKYYEVLGAGQRAQVEHQYYRNTYVAFPGDKPNLLSLYTGLFTWEQASHDPDWVRDRQATTAYSGYVLDFRGNTSLETAGPAPQNLQQLAQAIVSPLVPMREEGFGETEVPFSDPEDDDTSRFLLYGAAAPAGVLAAKRGNLYLTQQLAATDSRLGNTLRSDTKNYGVGENQRTLWKGTSECRSFVFGDAYDRFEKLQRFTGNGNALSVLSETVMPRMYPTAPYGKEQNAQVFFSLENLAYRPQDLNRFPAHEHGPNDGRVMWFPPYGLTINESHTANLMDVDLLGRIEPITVYNGAKRTMQLAFTLLIDYPPQLQEVARRDVGTWGNGCDPVGRAANSAIDALTPRLDVPLTLPDRPAPTAMRLPFAGLPIQFYFANDSATVDLSYEAAGAPNSDQLNADYSTHMGELIDYLLGAEQTAESITIRIVGNTSALATNRYNLRLSFRRAEALARDFAERMDVVIPERPDWNQLVPDDTSVGDLGLYPLSSKSGRYTFLLAGNGETNADQVAGDEASEINTRQAKVNRNAGITDVKLRGAKASPVAGANPALDPAQTPTPTPTTNPATATSSGTVQGFSPEYFFPKRPQLSDRIPRHGQVIDYYTPARHSQNPADYMLRKEFLHQLVRPGNTLDKADLVGSNSLFGRQPVVVVRIGDMIHAKAIVSSVNFDETDTTWDLNPEGMGVQTMRCNVSMELTILGGMSMEGPVPQLLTATDSFYYANSTFFDPQYYPQTAARPSAPRPPTS